MRMIIHTSAALLLLLILLESQAQALDFRLPIDIDEGFVLRKGADAEPYIFSANIVPTLELRELRALRFSFSVTPTFTNPRWDIGIGARISIVAIQLGVEEVGIRASVGTFYFFDSERVRISGGPIMDVDGLPRIGICFGYDFVEESVFLVTSVGIDFVSLYDILDSSDPAEPIFDNQSEFDEEPDFGED